MLHCIEVDRPIRIGSAQQRESRLGDSHTMGVRLISIESWLEMENAGLMDLVDLLVHVVEHRFGRRSVHRHSQIAGSPAHQTIDSSRDLSRRRAFDQQNSTTTT